MSCIAWNCRGLGNPRTVRALKKLIRDKVPSLVFLSETRKKDFEMNNLRNFQGLNNVVAVSCRGEGRDRAGGLACLWNDALKVQILSMSLNHVDMMITIEDDNEEWRCTGIYGFPDSQNKICTCELITRLGGEVTCDKWMLFGDFNLIVSQEEKVGGNFVSQNLISSFRDTLQLHNLCDLGFEGDAFTWTNNQEGADNIKARLDRVVATPDWQAHFPHAAVVNLVRHSLDHMPVLLKLFQRQRRRRNIQKVARFEQCWLRDEAFANQVRQFWSLRSDNLCSIIPAGVEVFHQWGKNHFGDVPKQICETQKQLEFLSSRMGEDGIVTVIREMEAKLDDLLESEEVWWSQRSRALWLEHGDHNTKFFHQKVSQRRKRNWVEVIFDEHGEKFTEEEDIANVFNRHFQHLFSSSEPHRIAEAVEVVQGRIKDDMREILDPDFTKEEVYEAIKAMKPSAAPGPDGMPAIFYQKFWDIVGDDVSKLVLHILNLEATHLT